MRPCFIAALLCTTFSAAAQQPSRTWQVPPGQEIVLGTYYEARYDPRERTCTALRAPAVQVLQTARQGTLTVQRTGSAAITDEPRCPQMRAPIAVLVYRAATDARGQEDVAWRVTYQSGQLGARVFHARIVVQGR